MILTLLILGRRRTNLHTCSWVYPKLVAVSELERREEIVERGYIQKKEE